MPGQLRPKQIHVSLMNSSKWHAVCECEREGMSSVAELKKTPNKLPPPLRVCPTSIMQGSNPAVSNTRGTAWGDCNIHGITPDTVCNTSFLDRFRGLRMHFLFISSKQSVARGILSQDPDLSERVTFVLTRVFLFRSDGGEIVRGDVTPERAFAGNCKMKIQQIHVTKTISQREHENLDFHAFCTRQAPAASVTHDVLFSQKTKTMRENTLCCPVAQFPNDICRNVKRRGCGFCSDLNGHKQLKQKKHNKSYFELNGGSDRGPGCHTEVPEGRRRATHSPGAAGSHFLPGAKPE